MNPRLINFQHIISTYSVLIALFFLLGGHWALFQSVAWVTMIEQYSAQSSFQSAVAQTFSGRHPCSLCKKISAAKQKETKVLGVLEVLNKKIVLPQNSTINPLPHSEQKLSYLKEESPQYSSPSWPPGLRPPRSVLS